ncbi:MAG TPA: hypothetical protein VMA75_03910 [Candidatus Paceibacterota bacterium]|nr:hypothetical protein [Candidatus Paceibacterota bacterium]
MLEKENIVLKNLDKRVGALEDKVDHLKKEVDGRTLLILTKLDSVAKRVDERMDFFEKKMDQYEESNRKTGLLLEKLDSKFDFALEGYGSLKALIEGMNERLILLEERA